jgi:hypothetical protein
MNRRRSFGAVAHPVVDDLAAAVRIVHVVEGDDIGAVLAGQQVDPGLIGFDPDQRPDSVCDRDRDLIGLGLGDGGGRACSRLHEHRREG